MKSFFFCFPWPEFLPRLLLYTVHKIQSGITSKCSPRSSRGQCNSTPLLSSPPPHSLLYLEESDTEFLFGLIRVKGLVIRFIS